jgi:dUTP pyrophosphatase
LGEAKERGYSKVIQSINAMLKVKLLHPEAQAPTVAYPGSDLGFDLYSVEDVTLEPGIPVKVRTGIAIEGPPGWGFVLGDRSSMAAKGVTYAGGRIDAGYRGEILVCLVNVNQPRYSLRTERDVNGSVTEVTLNRTDASITIHKGDKIAQMSPFEARTQLQVIVVNELAESARGGKGFGSTGR